MCTICLQRIIENDPVSFLLNYIFLKIFYKLDLSNQGIGIQIQIFQFKIANILMKE